MAQTYRHLAEGVHSPIYSDMPKNLNRQLDPMADALMKAMSLEDEITQLEQELMFKRGEIMDRLMLLKKDYQVVLIQRYFEKKTWGQIAVSMYYTERWIYKLHGQALKQLDDILKCSV